MNNWVCYIRCLCRGVCCFGSSGEDAVLLSRRVQAVARLLQQFEFRVCLHQYCEESLQNSGFCSLQTRPKGMLH